MTKQTKYIYTKNGNKPFTDKDKKRLIDNDNNYKYIYDETTKENVKVITNTNALISINDLASDKKSTYKNNFNNADYISIKDLLDEITNIVQTINDLNIQIADDKKSKSVKNIIPTNHTFNLVAPKIFNTTYKLDKYTKIDKDNNLDYDVKINITTDEIDDLRDIIFQEDITNKQLSLLPIDLALFIGFTDLSALNGNNIPINMQDTLRYITESKNLKLKDSKKLLSLYEDRLRTFDKFKVKAIITNKETNKQIRFLDPIAILENARVLDTSNNQISYIIGRSAILTILNYLSEQMKQDYLTTFNVANKYINDTQSNTIYILNMKYYILIKVLQMGNSKDRLNKYNPKINLDKLYQQTALLKGVKDLSKTEKSRLRASINKYLEHLISKGLLLEYDYTPFKEIASDTTNAISKKSEPKDSIYIKI